MAHWATLVTALVLALSCHGLSRATLPDQVHDRDGGFVTNGAVSAQSFTVGRDGILDRIEMPLRPAAGNPVRPFNLELRLLQVEDGVPGLQASDVLFFSTVQIPSPLYPTIGDAPSHYFQWVFLDGIGLPVKVGEQYAIAAGPLFDLPTTYQPELTFDWIATFPSALPYEYEGGKPWGLGGGASSFRPLHVQDLNFRTYVTPVPEPAAVVLAAMAFAVCSVRRPLRQRK